MARQAVHNRPFVSKVSGGVITSVGEGTVLTITLVLVGCLFAAGLATRPHSGTPG